MTTEQAVLIELLKSDILGKAPEVSAYDIDWKAVAKESFQQSVVLSALTSAAKLKEQIPAEVYDKWFDKACSVTARNIRVANARSELISILKKSGYSYIILKGEASAVYYKNPDNRTLGDVDFLIDPSKKDEIASLLRSEGYTSSMEGHTCHIVFKKPNAELEMHHRVAGIPSGKAGERIEQFLANAHLKSVPKNIGSGEFSAPTDLYHGMILLLHTQHHLLYEGIGLRHLSDLAAFINVTKDEPFWEEELLPLLKDIGLYTFLSVMADISVRYFGVDAPRWYEAVDTAVSDGILEDILEGGNFGKKDTLRGRSGNLITNHKTDGKHHGKLYNLFKTLKDSTDEVYPIVKKHPILYAIFMPYRAIKYIVLVICGKRVNLAKTLPLADKRQKLYDNLHIFEVN